MKIKMNNFLKLKWKSKTNKLLKLNQSINKFIWIYNIFSIFYFIFINFYKIYSYTIFILFYYKIKDIYLWWFLFFKKYFLFNAIIFKIKDHEYFPDNKDIFFYI